MVPTPPRRSVVWRASAVVVQGLFFAAFLVVAVVLGRDGSLESLRTLDPGQPFGGGVHTPLHIVDLAISQRRVPAGFDVALIAGVVVNDGDVSQGGVRIEASFEDGAKASGWAFSDVTALTLLDSTTIEALLETGARRPKSPTLAPGARAPFVILARVPAQGSSVALAIVLQ